MTRTRPYWMILAGGCAASVLMLQGCDRILEPRGSSPPAKPTPSPAPVSTSMPGTQSGTPVATPSAVPDPTPTQAPSGSATPAPTDDETPTPDATESTAPTPTATETPEPETTPTPEETTAAAEPAFRYYPPGSLEDNSGQGVVDDTIYVPELVFPIKDAPSYPQSQVYRYGGGVVGGDQCDPRNFSYPWRDNYCEKRTRENGTPYCPINRVHLGQDIRVGTPAGCNSERRLDAKDRKRYDVVAAEDGLISNIGRYTVNVRAGGRIYRYMHMNMRALEVELGQSVKAGDILGYVSNDFGGTPTTLHLHFEIKHNTAEHGWTWAPPYTSLVAAYERREGAPGEMVSMTEEGGDVTVVSE